MARRNRRDIVFVFVSVVVVVVVDVVVVDALGKRTCPVDDQQLKRMNKT